MAAKREKKGGQTSQIFLGMKSVKMLFELRNDRYLDPKSDENGRYRPQNLIF